MKQRSELFAEKEGRTKWDKSKQSKITTGRSRNQNVRSKQLINDKQSGDCVGLVEKPVSKARYV